MFLIALKFLLFAVIIVGPIVVGRELVQAARGKTKAVVVQEIPTTEEVS